MPLKELRDHRHDVPCRPRMGQSGIEDFDDGQPGIGVAEGGDIRRRVRVQGQDVERLRRRGRSVGDQPPIVDLGAKRDVRLKPRLVQTAGGGRARVEPALGEKRADRRTLGRAGSR